MIMKKLVAHIKRWNKWRKINSNGHLYHILVLFGIVKSPTFYFTLTDEEEEEIINSFCFTEWDGTENKVRFENVRSD